MLSNPEDRKKLMNGIKEISNSFTRIEGERELIKEIIADLSEKFDLTKPVLRKIARTYHKQNYNEETAQFEEFAELYEQVVNGPSPNNN